MRYLTLATVVGASLLVFEAIKAFSPAVDSLPTQWAIPDFAPNRNTAWALDSLIDDLLDPPAGPGPVTFDSSYPARLDYRIADLSNPILQPWARERLRKSNREVLTGEIPFRGREKCWPVGVPGFIIQPLVASRAGWQEGFQCQSLVCWLHRQSVWQASC